LVPPAVETIGLPICILVLLIYGVEHFELLSLLRTSGGFHGSNACALTLKSCTASPVRYVERRGVDQERLGSGSSAFGVVTREETRRQVPTRP
jgi:hypothetical protein